LQQVLAVLVAGYLLSDEQLGLFKSTQQVGVLIAFSLIVINAIFPPRFAELHRQGNMIAMGRLARQGAMLGVGLASPMLIVCFNRSRVGAELVW